MRNKRVASENTAESPQGIALVAIGASTGGPAALSCLLSQLPASFKVPIVIVQHMPEAFTAKLAMRLDESSALKVVEAQAGEKLQAGSVYMAPGNFHMVLDKCGADVFINFNSDEPENSCRPSVDPLFRSLAAIYGGNCLGIILTGMGADGLRGAEALHSAGSPVIVQDERSSVVWGMPGLVAKAGLAHQQVPLDDMGAVVTKLVEESAFIHNRPASNSEHIVQADSL